MSVSKRKVGSHQWRSPRSDENSAVCEHCGCMASDYKLPCTADMVDEAKPEQEEEVTRG